MNQTDAFGSGDNVTTPVPEVTIASEFHWIISLVVSLLVILANLWIAVAFIHHVVSTNVLKKKKSRRDVNGGLVMILAIAAVVVPFFRYFGTLLLLFVSLDPGSENGCEIANDFCVAGFGLSVMPTYGFLWARQRAFYGHPSLGHMFGTCVGIFSKISLALIILSSLCLLALGIYPVEYEPLPTGGCILIGGEEQADYRTYVYAVVMISSQLVLLGLFLHPIRVHAQSQKGLESSSGHSTKSEMSERSSEGLSETSDPSATLTNKNISIVTTEEAVTNNNETTFTTNNSKPDRSASLPSNNLLRIAKDLEPHRKSSENLLKVPEMGITNGKRNRSATIQYGEANPETITAYRRKSSQPSMVPKAVRGLKRKMRRTTMRSRKVYGLIKRILYLAVFSILSDLTVMVINGIIIPDDIPQTYSFVMYDFNLLINVVTVVLSFENWRKMMLSPCPSNAKE